jgi:hypothetical protein
VVVNIKIVVFWKATPWILIDPYHVELEKDELILIVLQKLINH